MSTQNAEKWWQGSSNAQDYCQIFSTKPLNLWLSSIFWQNFEGLIAKYSVPKLWLLILPSILWQNCEGLIAKLFSIIFCKVQILYWLSLVIFIMKCIWFFPQTQCTCLIWIAHILCECYVRCQSCCLPTPAMSCLFQLFLVANQSDLIWLKTFIFSYPWNLDISNVYRRRVIWVSWLLSQSAFLLELYRARQQINVCFVSHAKNTQ